MSTSSLDCALSTFVCYTEKEYGAMAMGEIEKRKLAKKISPHLLSEDGNEAQLEKTCGNGH